VTTTGSRTAGFARAAGDIERLSTSGLDLNAFRTAGLGRLRSTVTIDAAFFATVDPTTLLFTSALAEAPLATVTPQFLDNEYGQDDVNKFAWLAASRDVVGSLDQATMGDRATSARYQEVLAPLGLGDELRVALVAGGLCWGVLCLHRESAANGFDAEELAFVRRVAPALADGLRRSVALYPTASPPGSGASGPGIVVLGEDLSIVSVNPRAEALLADVVDADWPAPLDLPAPVYAVARQAADDHHDARGVEATTRLRRGQGGWISVHASPLNGSGGRHVAVVLDTAGTGEVTSLILAAHGLTPAQSRVVALVLQGRSTPAIVDELHISANTLQEHLHAVFDKLGIGSRRELVAALSGRPG
jgi:DNA-binding CsgD family transcriptional regulator